MKKVEAIIRREAFESVKQAMEGVGYPGMTVTEVKGQGKQKGIVQQWRGRTYRVELLPKVKLEVVVLDEDLPRIVDAIVRSARTGEVGDGKIFISAVEDAVRIRTGEDGFDAI